MGRRREVLGLHQAMFAGGTSALLLLSTAQGERTHASSGALSGRLARKDLCETSGVKRAGDTLVALAETNLDEAPTWEAVLSGTARLSSRRQRGKPGGSGGALHRVARGDSNALLCRLTGKVVDGRGARRGGGVRPSANGVEAFMFAQRLASIRGGSRPTGRRASEQTSEQRQRIKGAGAGAGDRSRTRGRDWEDSGDGHDDSDDYFETDDEELDEDEWMYDEDDDSDEFARGEHYYGDDGDFLDEDYDDEIGDSGEESDYGYSHDADHDHDYDYGKLGDDYFTEDDAFGDESGDDFDDQARSIERRSGGASRNGRAGRRSSSAQDRGGRRSQGGGAKRPRGTRARVGRGPRKERRSPAAARITRLRKRFMDAQADLKTKMSGVTHKGAKVIRELKGSVSSDLEKTLIKATRPDNDPAKRKHVNLLLQAAEHAFPGYMDPDDEGMPFWREGPYWMTLHKLWRRMAEKDYRTASKAMYVLHRVARGTTTESWDYFRATLEQMRKEEDRGTKSRYFSRRIIRNVEEDGRRFEKWLDSYAYFVLLRLQSFAPDLADLAAVDADMTHEEASEHMAKAEKLVEAALACELGRDLENDVTCDCLKLVIEDLCELWVLLQQKIELRLQQRAEEPAEFSANELRRTLGLLEFYLGHLDRARNFVRQSHQLLALYSHAVPRGLGDTLATDVLQEQVASIQEKLAEKAKAKVEKISSASASAASGKARKSEQVTPRQPSRPPAPAAAAAEAEAEATANDSTAAASTAAAAVQRARVSSSRIQSKRTGAAGHDGDDKKVDGSGHSAAPKRRRIGNQRASAEGPTSIRSSSSGSSSSSSSNKRKSSEEATSEVASQGAKGSSSSEALPASAATPTKTIKKRKKKSKASSSSSPPSPASSLPEAGNGDRGRGSRTKPPSTLASAGSSSKRPDRGEL